ncbi:hypothetical protein LTR37_008991 [Vermiconidia calcicola]|uniref:Uncharacterized protein n=1 Tax=Vermiconidia calcicola TaxID=1690605 RepID=A0ACC3N970_9PEZI|nr:hypothetical protein LTR37_008991 [Vermiconidia calcicola]
MPRTRSQSAAMRRAREEESVFEISDSDSSSGDDDYVTVWEDKTVTELKSNKRLVLSDEAKTIILKHAAEYGWAAVHLPSVDHLIDLSQQASLPFHLGKRVFKICINKLLNAINNLVTEKMLGPGLLVEPAVVGGRIVNHVTWGTALRNYILRRNFTLAQLSDPNFPKHFDTAALEPDHPRVSRSRLIARVVSVLVSEGALRKREAPANMLTRRVVVSGENEARGHVQEMPRFLQHVQRLFLEARERGVPADVLLRQHYHGLRVRDIIEGRVLEPAPRRRELAFA